MDQEPVNDAQGSSDTPQKPVIPPPVIPAPVIPPPPVIVPPPPPPPSPLDSLPKSRPSAGGSGVSPVKVNIRTGDEEEEAVVPGGLATFNSRVVAVVIDSAVVLGVVILLGMIAPWLGSKVSWLVFAGYMLTRDSLPFLGGQSVGKKAMKIRAVTLDGQPLTGKWEPGVIRNLPMVIPLLPLVELFVLLNREGGPDRGKRLGDEWGKTKVIVEIPPVPAEDEPETGPLPPPSA